MDEYGLEEKEQVKSWYDGFIFGEWGDIYNPWSILNYLDTNENAIWSLLVASGYFKVLDYEDYETDQVQSLPKYELMLTNFEVNLMF